MKDRHIITRKVQLRAVGDSEETGRVYRYISNGQYVQNCAYNILISNIYAAIISGEKIEQINELYKRGSRRPKEGEPLYSLYPYGEMEFPKGLMTANHISNVVRRDIKTATSRGLFKGKSALPNKRLDAPLAVDARFINFYHKYGSEEGLRAGLAETVPQVYMKFVDRITFQVVFGNPRRSAELRELFINIFDGSIKICESSLQLDSTGKKIILNLVLSIPVKETELREDTVVGVHFGFSAPVVCALSGGTKVVEIGDAEDFKRNRARMSERKERLYSSLKYTSGGHGRTKKFKRIAEYSRYQKNFASTYNHYLSRQIVDFAIKNHAGYINLEDLTGKDTDDFVLQYWSYWQLISDVEYKAAQYGIKTRTVSSDTEHSCHIKTKKELRESDQRISLEIAAKILGDNKKCRRVPYSTTEIDIDLMPGDMGGADLNSGVLLLTGSGRAFHL